MENQRFALIFEETTEQKPCDMGVSVRGICVYVSLHAPPYQAVFDQFRHQTLGQNVDFPLVFEGFWRNNKISVVPGRRREEG